MNIPARWTSLEMVLYDMLYISYLVPAARVRPLVPSSLSLVTVAEGQAFVSLLLFQVLEAKAARLPSPRLSYHQINLYTFVRDPKTGDKALFFLRKGMTLPTAVRGARFLKMPADLISCSLEPQRDERMRYSHYAARGEWQGLFHMEADEVAPRLEEPLPPFASAQEAVIFLTDALVGLYAQGDTIYRLEAWHPRFQPRVAQVQEIHFPLLPALGLVDEVALQQPHSVFLAPRGHFLVHLPPRRV